MENITKIVFESVEDEKMKDIANLYFDHWTKGKIKKEAVVKTENDFCT